MAKATASCHLEKRQHPSAPLTHLFPMLFCQKACLGYPNPAAKGKKIMQPLYILYSSLIWVPLSWKLFYYRGLYKSSSSTSQEHLPSLAGHQQSYFKRNTYCKNKKTMLHKYYFVFRTSRYLSSLSSCQECEFKALENTAEQLRIVIKKKKRIFTFSQFHPKK